MPDDIELFDPATGSRIGGPQPSADVVRGCCAEGVQVLVDSPPNAVAEFRSERVAALERYLSSRDLDPSKVLYRNAQIVDLDRDTLLLVVTDMARAYRKRSRRTLGTDLLYDVPPESLDDEPS